MVFLQDGMFKSWRKLTEQAWRLQLMNYGSRRIQKFNPLFLSKVLYLIGYGGKIHFKIMDLEFSHSLCTKDLKTSVFLVVKNIYKF